MGGLLGEDGTGLSLNAMKVKKIGMWWSDG